MSKEVHCPYCNKMVNKGVKYYLSGSGEEYAEPRDVCSGGCNTSWKDLVRWSREKQKIK